MDKHPSTTAEVSVHQSEEMSKAEVEVRLAIAGYLIPRLAGTPAGREVFEALVTRFLNRYPHHKLLTHLLICPDYLEHAQEDSQTGAIAMQTDLPLNLIITPAAAEALAQLVKRIGWSDARSLAVNDDEAYAMMDGIAALQRALAEAGYAPR